MVETDVYCVDILTQVSAIQSALNAFNKELLGNHIKTCVADGIRADNDEIIDEDDSSKTCYCYIIYGGVIGGIITAVYLVRSISTHKLG